MIKQFRKQYNVTLQKLADDVGVSVTAVRLWENGKRNPRPKNQLKLNQAMRLIRTRQMAAEYYKAIDVPPYKPAFRLKRKLVKLLVIMILVTILVALY
jgi:transcriptional regulator with XRE-family HTH domain